MFAEEQMSNKLVEVDQYATKQAQDDDRPSLYLVGGRRGTFCDWTLGRLDDSDWDVLCDRRLSRPM